MGLGFTLSTSTFSSEETRSILMPMLGWLAGVLRPEHAGMIHWFVRKGAHVAEYAILAVLWRRAFIRSETLAPARSGWAALGIAVACAVIDEIHQSYLLTRTGSPGDVVLDSFGAATAVVFAQVGWWRVCDVGTRLLLWVAAVGGVGALLLTLAAGGGGGVLWISVPAAAALLLYRWRRSTSRS
jgi:hypothetical protein